MCITHDHEKVSKIVSHNIFLQAFKVCILTKFLIFHQIAHLKRMLKIIGAVYPYETSYTPRKRYGEYFGVIKFYTHKELKFLQGFE